MPQERNRDLTAHQHADAPGQNQQMGHRGVTEGPLPAGRQPGEDEKRGEDRTHSNVPKLKFGKGLHVDSARLRSRLLSPGERGGPLKSSICPGEKLSAIKRQQSAIDFWSSALAES
jgi:hypothetical protein